jgi:hypothetical protein
MLAGGHEFFAVEAASSTRDVIAHFDRAVSSRVIDRRNVRRLGL